MVLLKEQRQMVRYSLSVIMHAVICISLLPTEPDAPPQNVMTVVLSSTEIEVSWEDVPAINENGKITMNEVQYTPIETFGGQISTNTVNITNTSMLFIVLTGLEEYVEYNISVRAYTSAGPGPYSIAVSNRTDTDGELGNNYRKKYNFLFQHPQNQMNLLRMYPPPPYPLLRLKYYGTKFLLLIGME